MHAAVREEPHEMERLPAFFGRVHHRTENRVPEEPPFADRPRYPDDFLVYDSARPQVQMTDLRVPHLSCGKSHALLGSVNQRMGKLRPQPVEERRMGQSHGVGFGLLPVPPTVQHDESNEPSCHVRYYRILLFPRTSRTDPAPPRSSGAGCIWRAGRCGTPIPS